MQDAKSGFRVGPVVGKGQGALSARAFSPGCVIEREEPLVAIALPSPFGPGVACAACFRDLESVVQTLARASGGALLPQPLPLLAEDESPVPDRLALCDCGAVCCSPRCRDSAREAGHMLLCRFAVSDREAGGVAALAATLEREGQSFELAVRLMARVIAASRAKADASEGGLALALQQAADELLGPLLRAPPLWELVKLPSRVPATQDAEWRDTVRNDVRRASELLRRVFSAEAAAVPSLFSDAGLGALIGGVRQNAMSLELESTASHYLATVAEAKGGAAVAAAAAALRPVCASIVQRARGRDQRAQGEEEEEEEEGGGGEEEEDPEGEEDDGAASDGSTNTSNSRSSCSSSGSGGIASDQRMLRRAAACLGFRGSAVYGRLRFLNHDCAPSASIEFVDSARALLVAARGIAPGEELTISYVEEDGDLRARRGALHEYGFTCVCARCVAEEGEEEGRAGGGGGSPPALCAESAHATAGAAVGGSSTVVLVADAAHAAHAERGARKRGPASELCAQAPPKKAAL
jgi:hypothetical protein